MYWSGIVIGAVSFLMIGLFHPIIIKCEYYFSARAWPAFLITGLGLCAGSLFIEDTVLSAALSVTGFASLWSIGELKHQEKRVEKGWFPRNPNRDKKQAENASGMGK